MRQAIRTPSCLLVFLSIVVVALGTECSFSYQCHTTNKCQLGRCMSFGRCQFFPHRSGLSCGESKVCRSGKCITAEPSSTRSRTPSPTPSPSDGFTVSSTPSPSASSSLGACAVDDVIVKTGTDGAWMWSIDSTDRPQDILHGRCSHVGTDAGYQAHEICCLPAGEYWVACNGGLTLTIGGEDLCVTNHFFQKAVFNVSVEGEVLIHPSPSPGASPSMSPSQSSAASHSVSVSASETPGQYTAGPPDDKDKGSTGTILHSPVLMYGVLPACAVLLCVAQYVLRTGRSPPSPEHLGTILIEADV